MNQLPITIRYKKKDGKLIPISPADIIRENQFIDSLKEEELVEISYEKYTDSGTRLQQNKVHKMIRILGEDTGTEFNDMKEQVKRAVGLVLPDGKLKSFADCSKEELGWAIRECERIEAFIRTEADQL
jgi:hypothetical protein